MIQVVILLRCALHSGVIKVENMRIFVDVDVCPAVGIVVSQENGNMDEKNDYIQLPPMKKDTSADVVSLEHLSKMERGKRKPSIDLIVAMASVFSSIPPGNMLFLQQ